MDSETPQTGWELVECDGAPAVLNAVTCLDTSEDYTRSELASEADVPIKTLYLSDVLSNFVDAGILDRVDEGTNSEKPRFIINEGSEVLAAARDFDDAVATAHERSQPR